jgi:Ca2+-binding RTX toxin-like protein
VITDDVRSLGQDVADYFAAHSTQDTYQDQLHLGSGISASDVARGRIGNDLVLSIGASDTVTMRNWFDGTVFHRIETISFADGSAWSANQAELGLNVAGTLAGTAFGDQLTATSYGMTLEGRGGNDVLGAMADGGVFDVVFRGGAGNDTLIGSYGRDLYQFDVGDGHDTIRDDVRSLNQGVADFFAANPTQDTYQDHLAFGAGISAAGVGKGRVGNDLVLTVNANDSVTVQDWFDGTVFCRIEQIGFVDGTVWTPDTLGL